MYNIYIEEKRNKEKEHLELKEKENLKYKNKMKSKLIYSLHIILKRKISHNV